MDRRTLMTTLIAAGAASAAPWASAQPKDKENRPRLQRLLPSASQRLIREKDDPPLLWAWSMNAVLNERNGVSNDIYAGQAKTHKGSGQFRELLQEWWRCHSREDALKTIDDLSNMRMGQANYEKNWAPLVERSEPEVRSLLDDELWVFGRMALDNREFLRVHGVKGWDLTRVQAVIGWAWLADWITLPEARELALTAAQRAQQEFNGWSSLGLSYLLGFAAWKPEVQAIRERQSSVQNLVHSPDSVWSRRPWRTPLTGLAGRAQFEVASCDHSALSSGREIS